MVSIHKRVSAAAAIALAILLPGTGAAQDAGFDAASGAETRKQWDYTFVPYLFAPSISGSTALGRVGGDVDVDPGTIFENLEAAFLARFEGRHESGYGFAIDYSMMNLGKGATSSVGDVVVDLDQAVLDVTGTYRFGDSRNVFDAYAGLRYWKLEHDTNITSGALAGLNLNRRETWVDPMVGLRWQRRVSDSWRVIAQGDIGGFGVNSDFAWTAALGGAYDGWENTSLFFMFRATGVDYETGTPGTNSYFQYDTVTSGPLIGVGFRF